MPAIESRMVPLGVPAPWFTLPNFGVGANGEPFSIRDDLTDPKVVVVAFICNHCPYVKHLADALAKLANEYQERSVGFVAINPNDAHRYPDDAPVKMTQEAQTRGYPFPYLYDETQQVAKDFGAACTPDFFVYDGARRLVYRGQFDDSRPGSPVSPTGADLRTAIERALLDDPPMPDQRASLGCSIKWKPGNEPN